MKRKKKNNEDIIFDFIAYTDGSCNNFSFFGEGGAAYVLLNGKDKKIIKTSSKCLLDTTNNRAELLGILAAISAVPDNSTILIRTDSQYCILVLDNKTQALPKANIDLVQKCFNAINRMKKVRFEWVKGHNDNEFNELADGLAEGRREEIIKKFRIPTYTYKDFKRPLAAQEKIRITRFNKWISSKDSKEYQDTIPF